MTGSASARQPGMSPASALRMSMSTSPQISPTSGMVNRQQLGHRGSHTFDHSELRKVSQEALTKEEIVQDPSALKVSNHSRQSRSGSRSPINNSGKTKETIDMTTKTPPRAKRISSIFRKEKKSSAQHNRTKSLGASASLVDHDIQVSDHYRSSLPNTPKSEGAHMSSMYPAIVSDLMHLKMDTLAIPSLAKPSPTSFLTGKEDEVQRTSESEPTPYQMEIPTLPDVLVAARLNEFVNNYRRIDQNFDLQQWVGMSRMDLRQVSIPQHVPIAQSILECGDDVCLRGVVSKGSNADDSLEVAIFEGQRQFVAVFRGTKKQQKDGVSKSKKKTAPLDKEHGSVEVYNSYLEEYIQLETECFALLDKLTDLEPFCDIIFTGHSFGGPMATIAALRYALGRPMVRISCMTFSSPKAGFHVFKDMVNSQPNLKMMRFELGQDGKCQLPGVGGSHAGHTIVMNGALGNNNMKKAGSRPVLAYKFEAPKPKKFKTIHPDIRAYVTALEEIASAKLKWPTLQDFEGYSGKGVVASNENRLVV